VIKYTANVDELVAFTLENKVENGRDWFASTTASKDKDKNSKAHLQKHYVP